MNKTPCKPHGMFDCHPCLKAEVDAVYGKPTEPTVEEARCVKDAVDSHERPFIQRLRGICEGIGYGRVIQLAEGWMDEKNPGWLKAKHDVIREAEQPDEPAICLRCDKPAKPVFYLCEEHLGRKEAEQPQASVYRNKLLKGLHGILTDANHPTPGDIDDIDGILAAVRIAVGPGQVGHVANHGCHDFVESIAPYQCGRCGRVEAEHPFTDPRCKPGLLMLAEARLEAVQTTMGRSSVETQHAVTQTEKRLRAEIERLKS